jgi:all-trans-retinol 13,14-reductase
MKSSLSVALATVPPTAFFALAASGDFIGGFALAAACAAGAALWWTRAGRAKPIEVGLLGFLLVGPIAIVVGAPEVRAVLLCYLATGAAGFATCVAGRPWTLAFADETAGGAHENRLFVLIHVILSCCWSTIFISVGALSLTHLAPAISLLPVALGIFVTVFGPSRAVTFFLEHALASQETCRWTPTPFADPEEPRDDNEVDVAIIGSGLGGLTAAALLARSGLRVFVAEQHSAPGGFCHSWLRKTRVDERSHIFRFDSGVHDITGVRENGAVSGIFDLLGVDIDWARMCQSNWIEDELKSVPEDWRQYAREVGARHPQCAIELERFFETAKTLFDGLFHGVERTHGVPLGPRSVGEMLEILKAHPLVPRWMDRPFSELMDAFNLTPAARAELCQLSGYVSDKLAELTVFDMIPLYGFYFHGGFYPRGGSGVLADRLVLSLLRDGGEIALKSRVEQILVEDGAARGLRLANGRIVRARAVVSNADLKRTVLELLPEKAISRRLREKFAAIKPAASAFMVHLGLDRRPDMTGVADVVGEDGLKVGLISPSAADPSAAPAGFATLELVALLPHEEARRWFADVRAHDDKALRFSASYQAKKRAFADRMIAAAERALPGLSESIVFRAEASPLTFQRYGWSCAGAIYGVAKTCRWKGSKGPVRDLWLAGAGNHGPGVEAVMIAGAKTAEGLRRGILSSPKIAPPPTRSERARDAELQPAYSDSLRA